MVKTVLFLPKGRIVNMIEGPLYYYVVAARHSESFCFFYRGKGKGELERAKDFLERSKLKMAATVKKYRTLAARSPSQ